MSDSSAVAVVSTSGVWQIFMPRAAAASRSICSSPTLKVAMTFTLSGKAAMRAASKISAGMQRIAVTPSQLLST